MAEREAGRHDGPGGVALGDPERLLHAPPEHAGSRALRRDVRLAQERRLHDADDRAAVLHERDGDPDEREAVEEVRRPVEGIHRPETVGALASSLLPDDRDGGFSGAQRLGDRVSLARSTSVT